MLDPQGRVIMISGANRGIGLATARLLAARGYRLSLGAREPASIDTGALGDALTALWHAEDAGTSRDWVGATVARFGRVDGVVMNAGLALDAGLMDEDETAFDAMWEVNFKGPLRLARAAMPALARAGAGRVVTIVSLAGKRLLSPRLLGYSASKSAALALSHAIRREGWADGVRATAICPGMVDTRMVADTDAPQGEFKIEPQAIAETVAYALALPDNAAVAEILVNSRMEPSF
jgi:NAD(P)-dependent dehydrogenase (short-subunit alcohol dehydrogenase family)